MSCKLETPDRELSQRILGAVSYKDRLPAGRLTPPVGIIPGNVRSLPELHSLLTPDIRTLPGIDLNALEEWVGTIIGDRKLADSVRIIISDSINYAETCMNIYELIGYRLDQARKIVEV